MSTISELRKIWEVFQLLLLDYHHPGTKTRSKHIYRTDIIQTLHAPLWPKLNYKHKQKIPSCRHTSFSCTSRILHFLQTGSLWQGCTKSVDQHHFFSAAFARFRSLYHILECSKYFKLFLYYLICYGHPWSVMFDLIIAKRLRLAEGSDGSYHFLAIVLHT